MLIPHHANGASVLWLHGTAASGKDMQVTTGGNPSRDLARFLSQHGFITLSPDHVCSGERLVEGERPYDMRKFHPRHLSGTRKGWWIAADGYV